MTAASVRPAAADDVPALATVQRRTWGIAYADTLPKPALAAMLAEDAQERWRDAVCAPPSPRHGVLVALAGATVTGFAAFGPALDDGLDPAVTAEIYALLVDPAAQGAGHGSRLLNGSVDVLRETGFAAAVSWLFDTDAALAAFLEGAGWAVDGSTRDLDLGSPVHQTRMATSWR